MTRIGKIARLSRFVREQLNRRLEDGEPGIVIVAWLNSLSPVHEVLAEHFGGRPISEQNLSEWKQGGFREWQKHQESRAVAREFLAEAEELEDEVGETALADRLSEMVTLALARSLREAANHEEKGPKQRVALLEIARELTRWRHGEHQMERVRIERERWEAEKSAAHEAELEAMREKIEFAKIKTRVFANLIREEYCAGVAAGTLEVERELEIRQLFVAQAAWLRECGVGNLPHLAGPPADSTRSK